MLFTKKSTLKKMKKKALFILKFIENLKKNYENRNLL